MIRGSKIVVCARAGGANTNSFLAAHFAKRNTKFGGGESEGGQKFLVDVHSPTPFLFARPSVQFGARSAPSVSFKKGSDLVKQTHIQLKNPAKAGFFD